jgi:hypothetical protein
MSETFPTAEKNTKEKEVSAQETLRQSPDAAQQPELTAQIVSNPRIKEMIAQRDAAQRQLNEAILDLYDREKSPAFQEAKRLLEDGFRAYAFGQDEIDSSQYEYSLSSSSKNENISLMMPKHFEGAIKFLSISNQEQNFVYETIKRLCQLSEELSPIL